MRKIKNARRVIAATYPSIDKTDFCVTANTDNVLVIQRKVTTIGKAPVYEYDLDSDYNLVNSRKIIGHEPCLNVQWQTLLEMKFNSREALIKVIDLLKIRHPRLMSDLKTTDHLGSSVGNWNYYNTPGVIDSLVNNVTLH